MGDEHGRTDLALGLHGEPTWAEPWPTDHDPHTDRYQADEGEPGWAHLLQPGDAWLFDGPADVTPVWGRGSEVIWAEGEALIVVAPQGCGKTTLIGQVVRARVGLAVMVLGHPVQPAAAKVLYLAMDRPRQIRRSLLRQFRDDERAHLAEHLTVWQGPPPSDLARHPTLLRDLARAAVADTVIVDSLKDAFLGLTDDEAAAGYNRARQAALVDGIEVCELHHMVKRGAGGARPTTLADVYGSVWVTGGAGSVVLLWGNPGDPIVGWHHLKQPMDEVGPYRILHDHDTGTSSIHHGADLPRLAALAGPNGLTAKAAAEALFDTTTPTDAEVEKARRRLRAHTDAGRLHQSGGGRSGRPAAWHATAHEEGVTGVTQGVTRSVSPEGVTTPTRQTHPNTGPQAAGVTEGVTEVTARGGHVPTPLFTGGGTSPRTPTAARKDGDVGRCEACRQPMTILSPGQTRHPTC